MDRNYAMNLHLLPDEEFIRQLTEIVVIHLDDENFGVNELTQQSGLSQSVLRRRLRKVTQKTITHFITGIRLQKAFDMLEHERFTVSEVASRAGFSSPAYFNTCFREQFGYPPGEVKRKNAGRTASGIEITIGNPVNPDKFPQANLKKNLLRIILMVILLFIVVGITGVILFRNFTLKNLEKSIAVLPFKNLGEDKADQYFADGVMDDILSNLSSMQGLRVIGRTSTEQFRETSQRIPDIARYLHVNFIVEGTVQKYGDNVRLRVQLIRARHREDHLWAHIYDRKIQGTGDIFNIQSQVARDIASELMVAVTPEEKQYIEEAPTTSLTALDFYRRGREEHLKYQIDNNKREALDKAEAFYLLALEYDSTFAQVYAGLAGIYRDKHINKDYLLKNSLDSVLFLSDKALSFNPRLSDAYYLRGVYFFDKGEFATADSEFEKAIKLNPSNWMAYFGRGSLYFSEDDMLKAIENLETAASLHYGPESPLILYRLAKRYAMTGFFDKTISIAYEWLRITGDTAQAFAALGELEFNLGNYRKSIEYYEKSNLKDSTNYAQVWPITYPYVWTGRFREALTFTQEYIKLFDFDYKHYFNELHRIAYIFWVNGFEKEAGYYFDKQMETCNKAIEANRTYAMDKFAYYDLAAIYAFKGDRENAYKNLRIYNEKKFFTYGSIHIIKTDPLLDNLRGDAEFQQIIKDQETKYRAEHERVRKGLEEKGML
jgi:TolB-like protein/AraC-like DNA-binding protein